MTLQDYFLEHPHTAAVRWHPVRNGSLTPDAVPAGSHKKAVWLCDRGHEWEASVVSVTGSQSGCPYCTGKLAIPGETDLKTVRPDVLTEWDFGKNTLDPSAVLPSSHEKAWWTCEKGHSWQATVFSRTREKAAKCPYCTGRLVLSGYNDLATLHPKLMAEWHKTLNGALHPENVTPGSNKKAWWVCHEGHVWQTAIYSRTRKKATGCPVCMGTVKPKEKAKNKPIRPTVSLTASVRTDPL